MTKKRHTPERIVTLLRQVEVGLDPVSWTRSERRIRKLPRQADSSKGDWPAAECLGRNVSGGTRPRLSWGRSPL